MEQKFLFEVILVEKDAEIVVRFDNYGSAMNYLNFEMIQRFGADCSAAILGYYREDCVFGSWYTYAYMESLSYFKGDTCLTQSVVRNEFPKGINPFINPFC